MQEAVVQQCFISDWQAGTVANVAIAFFTVALFVLQYCQHRHEKKVANTNHKVALFDKRAQVLFDIEDFLKAFARDGRPSVEAAAKLRYNARNAHFLFPEKPLKFVEEIVQKTFDHQRAHIAREPLRERAFAGEQLSPAEIETKNAALAKMHEIQDWFIKQIDDGRLQKEFAPYIKLPDTI